MTICYYAPEFESVAHELAAGPAGSAVVFRRISWGKSADGFPNIFIDHVKVFSNKRTIPSFAE